MNKRKILWSMSILLTFLGFGAVVMWLTLTGTVTGARNPAQIEMMEGIILEEPLGEDDRLYLQQSMQFLYDYLPEWFAYVQKAKPLILSLAPSRLDSYIAAGSECCDDGGNGLIVFHDDFGSQVLSSNWYDQTPEASQIVFLSTLVHEATHIRQRREGIVPQQLDPEGCIAAEHAAYSTEVEFAHALLAIQLDGAGISAENFRRAAPRHLEAAEEKLHGTSWKLYCLLAFGNQEQPEQ